VADRAVALRGSASQKNSQNETIISPSETKRFAGRVVSHWNPYGSRIRHFAGLFVFNDLSPFSFRRFRSMLFRPLERRPIASRSALRRAALAIRHSIMVS
jgi:hypothetical protein